MDKLIIVKMIMFYSNLYGIDPKTSLSVAEIESNFNPTAISKTGDYGIFQLQSKSFPQYKEEQLLTPEINIPEGILYLKKMKKECRFKNNNEFLICWNAGKKGANKIKHPGKFPYVLKVEKLIAMKGI